jgi:hypothetical protein
MSYLALLGMEITNGIFDVPGAGSKAQALVISIGIRGAD